MGNNKFIDVVYKITMNGPKKINLVFDEKD